MAKSNIINKATEFFSGKSKSDIEQALEALCTVRQHIASCAAKRAERQLNTGTLNQISKELGDIEKRLSGYASH